MVLGAAILVVALASVIHGAVGFGVNLLAVPVLLLLDPALVPGPALSAGLLIALLIALRERHATDRALGWAALGLLPGTLAGLALLAAVPAAALSVLLGVLVLLAVGLSALSWQPAINTSSLVIAGAVSGFLSTAASMGGPPMALLYAAQDGAKRRSTLSTFFIAASVVALLALVGDGRFNGHDALVSLALVPGVVAGFLLSGPLRPVLDRHNSRPAILTLSALAAVAAIVQGVAG